MHNIYKMPNNAHLERAQEHWHTYNSPVSKHLQANKQLDEIKKSRNNCNHNDYPKLAKQYDEVAALFAQGNDPTTALECYANSLTYLEASIKNGSIPEKEGHQDLCAIRSKIATLYHSLIQSASASYFNTSELIKLNLQAIGALRNENNSSDLGSMKEVAGFYSAVAKLSMNDQNAASKYCTLGIETILQSVGDVSKLKNLPKIATLLKELSTTLLESTTSLESQKLAYKGLEEAVNIFEQSGNHSEAFRTIVSLAQAIYDNSDDLLSNSSLEIDNHAEIHKLLLGALDKCHTAINSFAEHFLTNDSFMPLTLTRQRIPVIELSSIVKLAVKIILKSVNSARFARKTQELFMHIHEVEKQLLPSHNFHLIFHAGLINELSDAIINVSMTMQEAIEIMSSCLQFSLEKLHNYFLQKQDTPANIENNLQNFKKKIFNAFAIKINLNLHELSQARGLSQKSLNQSIAIIHSLPLLGKLAKAHDFNLSTINFWRYLPRLTLEFQDRAAKALGSADFLSMVNVMTHDAINMLAEDSHTLNDDRANPHNFGLSLSHRLTHIMLNLIVGIPLSIINAEPLIQEALEHSSQALTENLQQKDFSSRDIQSHLLIFKQRLFLTMVKQAGTYLLRIPLSQTPRAEITSAIKIFNSLRKLADSHSFSLDTLEIWSYLNVEYLTAGDKDHISKLLGYNDFYAMASSQDGHKKLMKRAAEQRVTLNPPQSLEVRKQVINKFKQLTQKHADFNEDSNSQQELICKSIDPISKQIIEVDVLGMDFCTRENIYDYAKLSSVENQQIDNSQINTSVMAPDQAEIPEFCLKQIPRERHSQDVLANPKYRILQRDSLEGMISGGVEFFRGEDISSEGYILSGHESAKVLLSLE